MNPQPICPHTTETQTLVSIITSKTEVEKIVLLGQTMLQTTTETVFTDTPVPVQSTAHYFLLVLVKKEEEHSLNCIQDKIENNLQHLIPATAIVFSINTFNQWFKEGHPFAHLVVTKARKLYDNEAVQLDAPVQIDDADSKRKMKNSSNKQNSISNPFSQAPNCIKSANITNSLPSCSTRQPNRP